MFSEEQFYTYNIIVGPRLGRTSSKEQYAYIYRWVVSIV